VITTAALLGHAEAIALKQELTELLSVEVDRAFAEQENVATAA
jgi:hypothetical protein